MRVAVTGASGFIGGRIVQCLVGEGHEVRAFGRRPATALEGELPAEYRSWDIAGGELQFPPPVEAVVHCAAKVADWGSAADFRAVNVAGTEAVLRSFPGAHFIHISSGSVYDVRRGPAPHREDDPLPARHRDAYSRTKRAAEQVVLRGAPESVILRPHAVYGPGDPTLLPRLLRGYRAGRLLCVGNGRNRISLTHVDNLAHAVALALEQPQAVGVYNVADEEVATVREVLRDLMTALHMGGKPLFIPRAAAIVLAALSTPVARVRNSPDGPLLTRYAVEQVSGNGVLDISRAKASLGYVPKRNREEAFREIAEDRCLHAR